MEASYDVVTKSRRRKKAPFHGPRSAIDFASDVAASNHKEKRKRVKQVVSDADRAELEHHYEFIPSSRRGDGSGGSRIDPPQEEEEATAPSNNKKISSSWQDRMVANYHKHLYKEFVLADLTTRPGQVGLRWRIEREVKMGKGVKTCGHKHCPSYQQQSQLSYDNHNLSRPSTASSMTSRHVQENDIMHRYHRQSALVETEQEELDALRAVPYGWGLADFEVPFRYVEHGETKQELVKLRLCLRCAPLLFESKAFAAAGGTSKGNTNPLPEHSSPALEARQARATFEETMRQSTDLRNPVNVRTKRTPGAENEERRKRKDEDYDTDKLVDHQFGDTTSDEERRHRKRKTRRKDHKRRKR